MYQNRFRISNREAWGYPKKSPNENPEERKYFNYYVNKFVNLALSRITYEGLPDEMPPLMIESYLLWEGIAVLAKNKNIDMYGVFGVNLAGEPDIYGIPVERIAYASNGQYFDFLSKDDSVIMWARPFATPEILDIFTHAEILAEAKLTQRTNLIQQRTPTVLYGKNQNSLTMDNFLQKVLQGIPFIKAKNDFKRDVSVESLDLKVTPQYNELSTFAMKEIADCLGGAGY